MKRMVVAVPVLFSFMVMIGSASLAEEGGKWPGVDESVVEKFAKAAGHEPWEPFINTDQGDLLLFVFLLAGVLGGFVMGYNFRKLFPPRAETTVRPPDV
jgi:ABC-type cobalt transport system substrate-binding protein